MSTALTIAEPQQQIVAYEPAGPRVGDETVTYVESILGADGVLRPTGREVLVTYRTTIAAAVVQGGRS